MILPNNTQFINTGNKLLDIANALSKYYGNLNIYKITNILTGVIADNSNHYFIFDNTVILKYTACPGYELPNTISVTNATPIYDKSTGTVQLSNVTGNVDITIVGKELPQLDPPTNLSIENDNLTFTSVENADRYIIYADDSILGYHSLNN